MIPAHLENRKYSYAFGRGIKSILAENRKTGASPIDDQFDLALEIGICHSSVNRIVLGLSEARLGTAIAISHALGLSIPEIIEIGEKI
jgi:hypothetical protein